MKAIVVGGGKIGYFLAQTLSDKEYQVVVIEKQEKECLKLADELKVEVICGDGTDLEVLNDAGMENATVVAAVTGLDEENLVICQIAKSNYGIEKTKNEYISRSTFSYLQSISKYYQKPMCVYLGLVK